MSPSSLGARFAVLFGARSALPARRGDVLVGADIASTLGACDAALVVLGAALGSAAVDRGTAGEQRLGLGRPAVVRQPPQKRISAG
jgi:hypothetical protein